VQVTGRPVARCGAEREGSEDGRPVEALATPAMTTLLGPSRKSESDSPVAVLVILMIQGAGQRVAGNVPCSELILRIV
jgi:hypothetical protein